MAKKITAILTCTFFLLFEMACTHVVKQPATKASGPGGKDLKILRVLMKSGDTIYFSESQPGRVSGNAVVGMASVPTSTETIVLKSDVKSVKWQQGKDGRAEKIVQVDTKDGKRYALGPATGILAISEQNDRYVIVAQGKTGSAPKPAEIVVLKTDMKSVKRQQGKDGRAEKITQVDTKDGKRYALGPATGILAISEQEDRYIIVTRGDIVSLPLSEIDLVWVKKSNPVGTVVAVLGGIAITLVALAAIGSSGSGGGGSSSSGQESCPFIYSYDGKEFIFDAEPYGGATSLGLKRTEWCTLEHLKDVHGTYRIRIANEVDETQHTDELKLVVVDHPRGVLAVPDETGIVHTFSRPEVPRAARDGRGRDILPLVRDDDWIFWQSRMEGRDPDNPADIRDELMFEFPKPAGATTAKLLFNGCNTFWASQMIRRFLDLHGEDVTKCYAALDAKGPGLTTFMNWNLREELYKLQIRTETREGWTSKGVILGGGPFASEDRVYLVDVRDVPGDTLRIKLQPPAGFWMINYLAVGFEEDLPVQTIELGPVEAVDAAGRDVRLALSKADEDYYVMPEKGNRADVSFLAPPVRPGLARTVMVKAGGYYKIHLAATGKARMDVLSRFLMEPGFMARYALQEYLAMEREYSQKR